MREDPGYGYLELFLGTFEHIFFSVESERKEYSPCRQVLAVWGETGIGVCLEAGPQRYINAQDTSSVIADGIIRYEIKDKRGTVLNALYIGLKISIKELLIHDIEQKREPPSKDHPRCRIPGTIGCNTTDPSSINPYGSNTFVKVDFPGFLYMAGEF